MTALLESGRMQFLAGADWLPSVVTELLTFPDGKHDDQVDALSHAAKVMLDHLRPPRRRRRGGRLDWGPQGDWKPRTW